MKKTATLLMAVIMVLSFTACGNQPKADGSTVEEEITPSSIIPEVSYDAPSAVPEAPESPAISTSTVTYYHGDEQAEKLVSETAEIPVLTAQAIIDLLYAKNVISESVVVNSCSIDKNTIQLDLGSNFADLASSMGTTGENIIIGSIVNTFLDAFKADGLNITVDGETLSTGHNIYDFVLNFYK